ncbi:uncharacterized protein N7473_011706 [Penicillium subrubescens]|uniref:MICOS complex subunit MIC12 n=1 Tax=Penicillium subrubescens TaxID=1316194 RepID=A0A1Q5TMF2_9EURO|nr:uncharacterized protein N7473_011706 [Penicillium subrubescens]KAJ5880653.1 hypothetical protein N7473_011706 [Penicillium subrubescens]OKP01372.1 hypothetical protein PENSUB_7362 [Penicillium subrubescens]
MNFVSGFFSGFALTTSVLYITITVHRATRLEQRRQIREQVDQINWLAASAGAYDRRFFPEHKPRSLEERKSQKEDQITLKDVLKHRWNQEVGNFARNAHGNRWESVKETACHGWNDIMRWVKKD